MNRRNFLIGTVSAAAVIGGTYFFLNQDEVDVQPLKVGWQPPWANQGQLANVLMKNDFQQKFALSLDFLPFTFGAPMTEAALAGKLDIIFLGDHPALKLISKKSGWKIISRLTNYRSALLTPVNSPIQTINDLKGKVIGVAVGSTTHRDTARILTAGGIQLSSEISFTNIDQAEHLSIMAAGKSSGRWGFLDAIATYDPTVVVAERSGFARVVSEWPSLGVIAASRNIISSKRQDVKKFLSFVKFAYSEYSRNSEIYNNLYSKISKIVLTDQDFAKMSSIEPNFSNANNVDARLLISETEMREMFDNVIIAKKLSLIDEDFILNSAFDFSMI